MSAEVRIDLGEARAALAVAARRSGELLASIPDPSLAVRRSAWNIAEVGAHLAVALRGFTEAAAGDHRMVAPYLLGGGAMSERLARVTAGTLAIETERDPKVLGRLIVERAEEFLAATGRRSADERIMTPWYGEGVSLSVASATALLVGEQLVHGYDVAGTVRRPWPIPVPEANLAIRAVTSMMPLAVNPATTAGLTVSYRVLVRRGGPRFVVRVDHGSVTVAPQDGRVPDGRVPDGRVIDCHLSADPAALLLVGYGRQAQWLPIAQGRLLAWGRRPWLALRFAGLFVNP